MKILLEITGGAEICDVAKSAIAQGYTHIRFNEKIFKLNLILEDVSPALPKLSEWLNHSPNNLKDITFNDNVHPTTTKG